ncbi:SDR family NAD(P)-dependent oxidoreductase [Streptomyces apricus]|uniref:SDR family oxidoreductase n=1 Tax=Streptomyces apricus TaxID=1828112 RepID=A0A5B0ADS7_9ACTN|nr:SDR family oxidoreductase [Streptomyces apricus]KAA0927032.1 SDR family oxidoreductase [Streptomyces apricus]
MTAHARFNGRTVVVTGANGWIGGAIARRFAAEGANIVAAARRRDLLDALVDELGPERALAVTTDVTRREDLDAAMQEAADRFGGIDVLVSNAGNNFPRAFEDLTSEDWRHLMATNAESTFLGAQAALPHLKYSRGSIVNIAATNGLGGDRMFSAFNAAKGAVVNFTRGLAFDLGGHEIRVNAVAPTLTVADELADTPPVDAWLAKAATRQALPGHGTPDDVAAAVAFLASADARFFTGVILPVDGGASAASGQAEFV